MPKCGVCAAAVSRYDDSIICASSSCAQTFHTKCLDVSLESLQALKTSGNIKVWRCDACKLKHNLIPPTTESSNTESPSIVVAGNGSVAWCNADIAWCNADIENIVSTKVKYAINIITEDIINLLRREIKLMSGNNNALSIELSELKKEVQNLKSENHELKDVVNNLKPQY
ncbi:FANCL C-terminal domain [Popillia japonica]|uniref:FANCL C-terminal domain n=1 Tax=Popillia japonica TaxID=7064 RepID=A0AAW1IZ77_POPJA